MFKNAFHTISQAQPPNGDYFFRRMATALTEAAQSLRNTAGILEGLADSFNPQDES